MIKGVVSNRTSHLFLQAFAISLFTLALYAFLRYLTIDLKLNCILSMSDFSPSPFQLERSV